MRKIGHIIVAAIASLMLLSLVSCHATKGASASRPKSGRGHSTAIATIPNEWKSLSIDLGPSDNKRLYREVKSWLGVPYLYGGHSKAGADCSGFVMEVYKTVYGKNIQRNSAKIFQQNCREIDKGDLSEGDLVFFCTRATNTDDINHVGLYLKENKFVHASSRGVVVADLNQNYWIAHWVAAGRVYR